MNKLQLLAAQIAGKVAEAEGILKADNPSTEDVTRATALLDEAKTLKVEHDALEASMKAQAELRAWVSVPTAPPPAPETKAATEPQRVEGRASDLKHIKPKGVRRHTDPSFVEDDNGSAAQKAYALGMWFLGAMNNGQGRAASWSRDAGLFYDADTEQKAMTESVGTAGGYLVPDVFVPDLIRIVERYGAARSVIRATPMQRDNITVPRRTSGLTAYYVGEGTAPTATDVAVDLINLVAKKLATLTYHSSELGDDAAIDVGNLIAVEIAQTFAYQEDLAVFLGDGTSTYGGIRGITRKFRDLIEGAGGTWTTDAHRLYLPTLCNGTGNLWSEFTLADFYPVVGNLIGSVDDGACAWVCHRLFFWSVMSRLALASGGTTAAEVFNGVRRPTFLGYPVVFAQVMPNADSGSQIAALFGDFNMSCKFGDRRSVTVARSDQFLFSTDQIAVRGTERYDFNCHDLGTANSTAASRVAGPLGALASLNA